MTWLSPDQLTKSQTRDMKELHHRAHKLVLKEGKPSGWGCYFEREDVLISWNGTNESSLMVKLLVPVNLTPIVYVWHINGDVSVCPLSLKPTLDKLRRFEVLDDLASI